MKTLIYFLTTLICMTTVGCNNHPTSTKMQKYPFEFEGVVRKTGFTTYMYGSHTIENNGRTFALQSTRVQLDDYINKRVIVKGSKMEGYPVDDGPELIDVKAIEVK
jgi:hypothetical protein